MAGNPAEVAHHNSAQLLEHAAGLEIQKCVFRAVADVDNFGTMSVTPCVEVEMPITKRWSLKPLAYGGRRTEMNGPRSAGIYVGL